MKTSQHASHRTRAPMLLAHTLCNFAKTPPWSCAQAGPPWISQLPGATRDLTTPQPLSIHPQLRHLFPNSRLRPLPPCHEPPPALHASIYTQHSTHSIHSGTPVTRWVWDSTKRPAYANSLQSLACGQLLQHSIHLSSMHQLNQADNAFTSARTTASRSAGFRQKKPAPSNSTPTQHQRPTYWDQACRSLQCQWRRAERRNPGSPLYHRPSSTAPGHAHSQKAKLQQQAHIHLCRFVQDSPPQVLPTDMRASVITAF